MPSVYLAGPDVFRLDAVEHLQRLARVAEGFGLEALVPIDGTDLGPLTAHGIYEANTALLKRADGVIANLAPFRGTEPDSGTVFEVGVAIALGLPVVAYGVPKVDYAERVTGRRDPAGILWDAEGRVIEDFGLPMNLMLSCSVHVAATAEDAIRVMADLMKLRAPKLGA